MTAAARGEVEVTREYKHRHKVAMFHMFGCIIDSGRPVKNGSSLNPSGGVGGLYLEQYSSLNYTFKGGKTFIQSKNEDKLTGGPERKHLMHPRSRLRLQRRSISTHQKKIFLLDEWATDSNQHLADVDWWPSTFLRWTSRLHHETIHLARLHPQCNCVD